VLIFESYRSIDAADRNICREDYNNSSYEDFGGMLSGKVKAGDGDLIGEPFNDSPLAVSDTRIGRTYSHTRGKKNKSLFLFLNIVGHSGLNLGSILQI
jgi:hypothetical protein